MFQMKEKGVIRAHCCTISLASEEAEEREGQGEERMSQGDPHRNCRRPFASQHPSAQEIGQSTGGRGEEPMEAPAG